MKLKLYSTESTCNVWVRKYAYLPKIIDVGTSVYLIWFRSYKQKEWMLADGTTQVSYSLAV